MLQTATLFNIQRYSLFDGPGIRTVFFFKGCPLSCQWCSNPESQKKAPEVAFEERNCVGCGGCTISCPEAAILSGKIDRARCNHCMICVKKCPTGALICYGKEYTVAELVKIASKDIAFYRRSEGGVTLSGGEPLLNWEFACSLLKACKEEGLNTAVETCGAVSWENISCVMEFLDTIYFDIKHIDDEKHLCKTGGRVNMILSNIKMLTSKRSGIVIRFPLIPGFNSTLEEITAIAKWIADNAPGVPVEIMGYHRYGEKKYAALGRDYLMKGIQPPSNETVLSAVSVFQSFGIDCVKLH